MTRITKDPEERKQEIIEAAEELFNTKGFEETAVSDIVKKVGVAQGLFYYYFKAKDEVMNAVLDKYTDVLRLGLNDVLKDKGLDAQQKLRKIAIKFFSMGIGKDKFTKYLHQPKNSNLHRRIVDKFLGLYMPILIELVEQGIKEGFFDLEYPKESIEILVAGLNDYFHNIIFIEDIKEYKIKIDSAVSVIEKVLGAKKGSFRIADDLE